MDKKVLVGIINAIVAEIATENGLDEGEGRALVGIWLRKNREAVKRGALAPFVVEATE